MKESIQSIINWNTIAGNGTNNYSRHLETSMLSEEMAEVIIALKENNRVEAVDWILDTLWVWIWTLHKLWLTAEQINNSFEEIKRSNYSKFTRNTQDTGWTLSTDWEWKITKPSTFSPPNLKQFWI